MQSAWDVIAMSTHWTCKGCGREQAPQLAMTKYEQANDAWRVVGRFCPDCNIEWKDIEWREGERP